MLRRLLILLLALCLVCQLLDALGNHAHSRPSWFWTLWWRSSLFWRWGPVPLIAAVIGLGYRPRLRGSGRG